MKLLMLQMIAKVWPTRVQPEFINMLLHALGHKLKAKNPKSTVLSFELHRSFKFSTWPKCHANRHTKSKPKYLQFIARLTQIQFLHSHAKSNLFYAACCIPAMQQLLHAVHLRSALLQLRIYRVSMRCLLSKKIKKTWL